ncbi:capsid protein [Oceanobacillus sp. E9]|uniref:phage major capsid protein n=1 Tax=Oceanobacillus sp. E9 TaxID=1742575 RepID=UPI00084E8F57|nr:phage major capsid protein [Oceanobacillus sp. E9]OEH52963.1 capsid protein [Oceanobacillus sp. E9]
MLKQVMLKKKLDQRTSLLEKLIQKDDDFAKRSDELEFAINEAESEEEVSAVEEEIETHENDKSEHDEEKKKLEDEIGKLEKELNDLKDNEPKNEDRGGKRNMGKDLEVREGIKQYVQSKGQVRDGFTSVEAGPLIPEDLLQPVKAPEETVNLENLITTKKVTRGSGKYPVIHKSGSKMVTVEELEKNPELNKPTFTEVNYDIDTYRGYIPVSQEAIDDADYDVAGLIAEEITDQELNTKNAAVAAILKSATPKAVTGLDGLKEVFNIDIKKIYTAKAVISSSLYNELDTLKDANGRYLLQDDITVASGKRLFGKEVVVLDDDMIGEASGDLVGFIGDPKAFATLFDRKQASVKWVDHNVYGQLLAGFVRFDVQSTDTDAGYYVTYTPEPEDDGGGEPSA